MSNKLKGKHALDPKNAEFNLLKDSKRLKVLHSSVINACSLSTSTENSLKQYSSPLASNHTAHTTPRSYLPVTYPSPHTMLTSSCTQSPSSLPIARTLSSTHSQSSSTRTYTMPASIRSQSLTPAHTIPNSIRPQTSFTHTYTIPASTRSQSSTPAHTRPASIRPQASSTPTHTRPASIRPQASSTPTHTRPASIRHEASSTPTHTRPASIRHEASSTPTHTRPTSIRPQASRTPTDTMPISIRPQSSPIPSIQTPMPSRSSTPIDEPNESFVDRNNTSRGNFQHLRVLDLKKIVCEAFREFNQEWEAKFSRLERKIDENSKMLAKLISKKRGVRGTPRFLPFKSVEDLNAFDGASEEDFEELVNYLVYLGGVNAVDSAALYFKNCFDPGEEISTKVSWLGKRRGCEQALEQSKFAQACEEAMGKNLNINNQNRCLFIEGMTKALKSLKERNRRRNLQHARIIYEQHQNEDQGQEHIFFEEDEDPANGLNEDKNSTYGFNPEDLNFI